MCGTYLTVLSEYLFLLKYGRVPQLLLSEDAAPMRTNATPKQRKAATPLKQSQSRKFKQSSIALGGEELNREPA